MILTYQKNFMQNVSLNQLAEVETIYLRTTTSFNQEALLPNSVEVNTTFMRLYRTIFDNT